MKTSVGWLATAMLCLGPTVVTAAEPIKIGTVVPLTGYYAKVGTEIKRGIDANVGELNRNGGLNGRTILLIVLDGQSDKAVTEDRTRQLVAEKVVALIAPCCDQAAEAAERVAAEANIITVFALAAPSSALAARSPSLTQEGYAFLSRRADAPSPQPNQEPPSQLRKFFDSYRVKFGKAPTNAAVLGYGAITVFSKMLSPDGHVAPGRLRALQQSPFSWPIYYEQIVPTDCNEKPPPVFCN